MTAYRNGCVNEASSFAAPFEHELRMNATRSGLCTLALERASAVLIHNLSYPDDKQMDRRIDGQKDG